MRHIAGIAGCATLISTMAAGQTIHRFSLPGGVPTCGIGIARDGTITGDNPDANVNTTPQAFIYHKGVFAEPAPAVPSGIVSFTGINASHVILVDDFITSGPYAATTQSFTYAGGATTQLTWPNSFNIAATGIDAAGTIVGSYQMTAGGPYVGFIDRAGRITTLNAGAGQTSATGIDPTGRIIVGDLTTTSFTYTGWLYQHGKYTAIAVPGAVDTFISGVNRAGEVSGSYSTDPTQPATHGFLYRDGTYTTFDVPGSVSTQLGGLTDAGTVTGCYTDANGVPVGFYTRP
jgi:hypothetical protein